MNFKVVRAVNFLNTCTSYTLKKKLKGNPFNDDYSTSFSATSQEYTDLKLALFNNNKIACKGLYLPTAIKLVNKF